MSDSTREVFVNITPLMRGLFYALIFGSLLALGSQIQTRARLWLRGQAGPIEKDWRVILNRLFVHVIAQRRVRRKTLGGVLHLLLFSGFVVLTIGTTLLAIADYGPVNFHHGTYYLFYELTMDVFGVAFCAGCVMAMYRRAMARPTSLGHQPADWLLLGLLLALGLSGFLVEALRLHFTLVTGDVGRWSIVGWAINRTILRSISVGAAQQLHLYLWWSHAIMVALLFVYIPHTRFFHAITGPLNIALRPSRHAGALAPVDIGQVEQTGRIGISEITHYTQQQLLSLDACMECGRCEDACPAFASHKPLSPKSLVTDLRRAMETSAGDLHEGTIQSETLWSCTMCQACVHECPVLIGHVDLISDLRRHLVGEGQIAGPPAKAMRNTGANFNPYGRPNTERFAWADGLDIPTVESNPGFEYLMWVGCAASFDPRAQKVARATAQLFQAAGVNFAVLGNKERCTGDTARRLGDELLFQELAGQNIQTLNTHRVKKIVTPCPHCMNTLGNEYSQFGGEYEVMHHSQLLAQLVSQGRLDAPADSQDGPITLHDPCYLARVNGETAAPRALIGKQVEMPRHGEKTFCCGAGGGRMWFEESPAQRVSHIRAAEAAQTGAKTLATACPFCLNMMTDGCASAAGAEQIRVLDVSEILINGIRNQRQSTPQAPV